MPPPAPRSPVSAVRIGTRTIPSRPGRRTVADAPALAPGLSLPGDAVDAGIGPLIDGGEGHEVTGVCGRALCFAGETLPGAWMTGRRPGVIAALSRPAHQLAGAA